MASGAALPPQLAFYLDVRPAIDDLEGVKMRVRRSINRLFGMVGLEPAKRASRSVVQQQNES